MTQTWAIFLESYRNLNSKKLFWLVLILSGVVVAAFACVGINEQGIKLAFWQFENEIVNSKQLPPDQFYKFIFVEFGIGLWLTLLAAILALISTSGIFPDLLTGGLIDLLISKPISRLRLFFTEYLAGLLFVTLQVMIFCLASFLIIGLRGGVWEPGLFLAVPLVVCFFSYLFSVCVLLGILTRSTVAALLLTLLFWLGVSSIGAMERGLLSYNKMQQKGVNFAALQAENIDNKDSVRNKNDQEAKSKSSDQSDLSDKIVPNENQAFERFHDILYAIHTVLPKTSETINLLERSLIKIASLEQKPTGPQSQRMLEAQKESADILNGRSIAWIIGTSLGFEAVVLFLAAWIFCRRDY